MHISSKKLRVHGAGGFLVFLVYLVLMARGKKSLNLSQIFLKINGKGT